MLRAAYVRSKSAILYIRRAVPSIHPSTVRNHPRNNSANQQQFAQELLSTFSTSLGEVALQPSTGGTFVVTIHQQPQLASGQPAVSTVLWDRKVDGGFPETKELKRRVRDVIEPGRDLGHVDRHHAVKTGTSSVGDGAGAAASFTAGTTETATGGTAGGTAGEPCQDCT